MLHKQFIIPTQKELSDLLDSIPRSKWTHIAEIGWPEKQLSSSIRYLYRVRAGKEVWLSTAKRIIEAIDQVIG